MATPTQMYTKSLGAVKGWPSLTALDKTAALAANEVVDAGMVMSLNSNGQFVPGLAAGAMPVFAMQNSTDFDVIGDDGNVTGRYVSGAIIGHISGLVATGGFELETTAFDSEGIYTPNTALTAGAVGAADEGVIKAGVPYVNDICGVVSDGVASTTYGVEVLRFWPVWLPAISTEASTSLAL